MIRKTIDITKNATFMVMAKNQDKASVIYKMPLPQGTGFFISQEGKFLTAYHVIEQSSIDDVSLYKKSNKDSISIANLRIVKAWPEYDIVLLHADFSKNHKSFIGGNAFPYLELDFKNRKEGTPIYSFGYPLPEIGIIDQTNDGGLQGNLPDGSFMMEIMVKKDENDKLTGAYYNICERTTSAIISATEFQLLYISAQNRCLTFVIDKPLNPGNSGGPIIAMETGKVLGICTSFQIFDMPQRSSIDNISIPSLYGLASSLKNIESELKQYMNKPKSKKKLKKKKMGSSMKAQVKTKPS